MFILSRVIEEIVEPQIMGTSESRVNYMEDTEAWWHIGMSCTYTPTTCRIRIRIRGISMCTYFRATAAAVYPYTLTPSWLSCGSKGLIKDRLV